MRVMDVLHSCSHGQVAEAAIVSIGGGFATRVRSGAAARGQTVGEYTSERVKGFSQSASERDWRFIAASMHGADLALLAGLEAVVTRMMDGEARSAG